MVKKIISIIVVSMLSVALIPFNVAFADQAEITNNESAILSTEPTVQPTVPVSISESTSLEENSDPIPVTENPVIEPEEPTNANGQPQASTFRSSGSSGYGIQMSTSYSDNRYGSLEVDLAKNEAIHFQFLFSVSSGTVDSFKTTFLETTETGQQYLEFTALPVIETNIQDSFTLLYSTDGTTFTETIPAIADLVAFRIQTKTPVSTSAGTQLKVNFSMRPIDIPESAMNTDILAFGQYSQYDDSPISWAYPITSYLMNFYKKVPGADVTVHYKDVHGNTLAPDVILSGNIGEYYYASANYFPDYPYYIIEGESYGYFTDQPKEVTYIYDNKPPYIPSEDVTVHYKDTDGKMIAPDTILSGSLYDYYETEQKNIKGYTFKEIIGQPQGYFMLEPQEVTYVYEKDMPVPGKDVTVHYKDSNGNLIAPDIILSGNIGEAYTSKQKDIAGYTFKEVQGNTSGTFSEQPQEVTYVYEKNMPVPGKDVIVHYKDDNGNLIAPDIILSGNIGEAYTSKQEDIAGYTFKEVQGNTSGTFSEQSQEVTYVYEKNMPVPLPITGKDIPIRQEENSEKTITPVISLPGNNEKTYVTDQKTAPTRSLPNTGTKPKSSSMPALGENKQHLYFVVGISLSLITVACVFQQKRKNNETKTSL